MEENCSKCLYQNNGFCKNIYVANIERQELLLIKDINKCRCELFERRI